MERIIADKLSEVIYVDEDRCVNCHACISACPVKFCNNGKGNSVKINTDMCIACGKCLDACAHEARKFSDDFNEFSDSLENGDKIIVGVAPSIVANFPDTYLKINSWLKEKGVAFVFDVSFGAELTVKSYVEHLQESKNTPLISQPCPAIVSYIQLYKPELLEYLAPVDSPMLHAAKMIKHFYPEYSDYKLAFISPCLAKKREYDETGIGDFNVTMKSLQNYFNTTATDLNKYHDTKYDTPDAERAVSFSTPGGLLKTIERWNPDILTQSRKVEGADFVYDYLNNLDSAVNKGIAPVVVDCLNCEYGCNSGPATVVKGKGIDEIEHQVISRTADSKTYYGNGKDIEKVIDKHWQPGLYKREYKNLWGNINLRYPNKEELNGIYASMHKYTDDDLYNCVSCGYNECKHMATAIFNDLNKPENCHHYLQKQAELSNTKVQKSERRVKNILQTAHDGFVQISTDYRIEQANIAFKSMLKCNDLVGRSFFEFLDEKNTVIFKEQIKLREMNKNSSYEMAFTRKDGGSVLCLLRGAPLFDENGERIGSFAMMSDITELKEAEEELLISYENLELKVEERTRQLNEMMEELKVSNETIQGYNKDLEQQKEEIESQRYSIQEQRDILQEQSEKIQSSIRYAKHIQMALMPDRGIFERKFKEHFIFLKPKDVVSGDFYWIKEYGSKVIVTAADCTGHGVPGALMSMLGISSLNDITNNSQLNGELRPNHILDRLKISLIESLNQTGRSREQKETIDLSMVMFDLENQEMIFSGANLPVFIFRNGEVIEIKGDLMPVGISGKADDPFKSHTFNLQEGDAVYMFSDGITDLFNGKTLKKLNKKRFKEMVVEFGNQPMEKQKDSFIAALKAWAGNEPQIDDMLLIGIRV